jgi:hypothetical protein
MSSELPDVLELAFQKFDSFQTLWSLFFTVILGCLSYQRIPIKGCHAF